MKRNIPLAAWIILILFLSGLSSAGRSQVQVKETKAEPPNQGRVEQKPTQNEMSSNQQRALALLSSLFDKAKEIDDAEFKIRAQAQIADALWKYNPERARQGFIDAFHAIDTLKVTEQKGPVGATSPMQSPKFWLRQEILKMLWPHDSALAELLQQSIDEGKSQGTKGSGEQAAQYMYLAADVAINDPERAAQMVAESLKAGIDPMTVLPLNRIRESNPSLANEIFAQALSVAQAYPTEVIHNIGHLMYFVLPSEMDTFYGNTTPTPERRAAIEMFLNCAYKASLQKVALETEAKNPSPHQPLSREEYSLLDRMLALFDQYRPEQATELRAKLASVMDRIPPIKPSGSNAPRQPGVDELLDKAKSQGTFTLKDRLYMQAAYGAANEGDIDRALSIMKNVENLEDRLLTESTIRWQALLKALKKEELDAAYKYAKDTEFAPQRVISYKTIIQKWLEKKDTTRASELVDEISQWLGKTDVGPDQAMGLLSIAGVAAGFDAQRGFEIMHSTVKSLNAARFDLPQGVGGGTQKRVQVTLTSVDFRPVFPPLAKTDFDRALVLAQSLEKKELAVLAQVAVCKGVLIAQPAPARSGK